MLFAKELLLLPPNCTVTSPWLPIPFAEVSFTDDLKSLWPTAGRCLFSIPLGRSTTGNVYYGVATALHDGKGGLIGNVGLLVAARNVSAFVGRYGVCASLDLSISVRDLRITGTNLFENNRS